MSNLATNHPGTRVLVVDDERVIADSLAEILKSKQYDARVAYSAEDAIVVAREFLPRALVSDVVMNELTGLDLAVYFARYHPACKVLLFSGQIITSLLVSEAEMRGQFVTVLPKPVHPEDILAFVAGCA